MNDGKNVPGGDASVSYSRLEIPVEGGMLACGRWGLGERIVVASHGITANHLSWQRVGELVDAKSDGGMSLLAVDHRGRAGSALLPGPFGLAAHADDIAAVLAVLGQRAGIVVGHSMGAFVATTTAERHPSMVERLVLVDGGLPLPIELPP
ncbi:MAG: alpha/beta fold hydrolase, partial [Acidimicrobiales bacterium]